MAEKFFTHRLDNGLTLVAQQIDTVSSATMTIAIPAGASRDPTDKAGAAAVGSYWLFRGAGKRNSRELNDALDSLGCQHHESVQSEHLLLSAAQLGKNLSSVVEIYGDIVKQPHLSDGTFNPCKELVLQALDGLEDQPMEKCNAMIREMFYPPPLGRNPLGQKETVKKLTPQLLREHLQNHLSPDGTIIAAAGKFDWDELREGIEANFGNWQGIAPRTVEIDKPKDKTMHVEKQTAQVQIALAWPAATIRDKYYYAGRIVQMILSGGMGSRLFVEVREKRGLVYAIVARYHSLKDYAGIFVYAGTTPQRAQETLTVTIDVLQNLQKGIEQDALSRAKTQLKSALIMQGESTSARADALAGDFYHLGKLRSLEEISAAIEAVSINDVMEYLQVYPVKNLTMLTIGPEKLDSTILP
ncbi:MAG: insulinase family protein [Planctomycetes bacterium]|nr:insulinase family protein [Planctomycetota bacterium]